METAFIQYDEVAQRLDFTQTPVNLVNNKMAVIWHIAYFLVIADNFSSLITDE